MFTGREDILHTLELSVRRAINDGPHQNQCRIVIYGMGGQGKSEICLQLAQRVRSLSVLTLVLLELLTINPIKILGRLLGRCQHHVLSRKRFLRHHDPTECSRTDVGGCQTRTR